MEVADDGRASPGVEYGKACIDIPDEPESGRTGTLNSALSGELDARLGIRLARVGMRPAEAGRVNAFVNLPSIDPEVEESMDGAGDGVGAIGIPLFPLSEMERP